MSRQRMYLALMLAVVALLCARPAAAGDPKLEAEVARVHAVLDEISRLTPAKIARLSAADATRIAISANESGLALMYDVSARANSSSGEEFGRTLKEFYATNGLDWFFSKEFGKRLDLITARADKAQMDASTRSLEVRYPAYGNYLRRARVKNALLKLARPMKAVANLETGGKPLRALPASELAPAGHSEGVRSASYANGRFTIVFDDRVVDGGTLEVRLVNLPDGKIDWRCSAAPAVRKFAPPPCRH